MARKFSTEFIYKNKSYEATVIISADDTGKTISIEVPQTLQEVVPKRKLVIKAGTGKPENGQSKDPALVESILAAVKKHEEKEVRSSLWS